MSQIPDNITSAVITINKLRLAQRKIELTSAASRMLVTIFVIIITATSVEILFQLPPMYRSILVALVMISLIFALALTINSLKSDALLSDNLSSERLWALKIGYNSAGDVRDRLLNAIQINRVQPDSRDQFSVGLARSAMLGIIAELGKIDLQPVLEFTGRRRSLKQLSVVFVTLILFFTIYPNQKNAALYRLIHPLQVFAIEPTFNLQFSDLTEWAYRGEAVEFSVLSTGDSPKFVEFIYNVDGGGLQTLKIDLIDGSGDVRFNGFTEDINYYARWKDVVSASHRLQIVTRPQITEFHYRLHPPAYSRLPVVRGLENVGDVDGFKGSRLELNIRASKTLSEGWLTFRDEYSDTANTDSLALDITGMKAYSQFILRQDRMYQIHLRDTKDHPNADPVTYQIKLLIDEFPSVEITFPDADVALGDNPVLPLEIEADDDFGIRKMELAFQIAEYDTAIQTISLPMAKPGIASASIEYQWDLGDMFLMPGDVIRYWAICWDNDNVSGPKRSESEQRLVRLPTIEEIFAGAEEAETMGFEQAEKTLEAAQELKDTVEEIIEEMRRNPEVDWEKQQQLQDVLDQQKKLEESVSEVGKTLENMIEQMEKHNLLSDETLQKYQELQDLIAEVSNPDLKKALEKLQKAMEEQSPEDILKALEEFDFDRESFMENIERTMNILKQLQLERRMDELVKQVEEILNQQENILDEIDHVDSGKLADKQDALSSTMEMFEDRLKDTQKLAEDSNEDNLSEQLGAISDSLESKDIPKQMSQASQDISSGNKDSAKQKGQEAARQLSELASQLSSAQKQLIEQRKDELAGKLRKLTEDLIYLSVDQEDLNIKSIKLGTQSPRYRELSSTQGDISNGLDAVTNRLIDLSKETFFVTPELGASLGKAAAELDKAIEKYTNRTPRSVSTSQKKALGEINNSARMLLDVLSQLKKSGSSSGYEEMMEKLSQMAGDQQSLNQQSMPTPGMQGSPSMPGGQQLSRMAAEQRALQGAMQQLSEDGEGQGMEEVLGDLDAIAKAMGEIADDMEDKNINARTRRLQEQIVSRMLDATRSARQKEYSKKRESKTGKRMTRNSPLVPKFDASRDQLRRDLKKALREGYSRDYRRLIKAYFHELETIQNEK